MATEGLSHEDLYNPDLLSSAADFGLTYAAIQETDFAGHMESVYEFAYLGRRDMNSERMESDSYYTWLAAILLDQLHSGVRA